MATVYLALDAKHHRPVALKVLHSDLAVSLGPERFRREIDFAAKLQHPHILTVLDSGETAGGLLWFTMPYVEGESLRDRLARQHQLPLDDALRITREAALALDYAHRHGVVHRDIKPENILLVDGQAMVADFGIARALGGGAPASGTTLTQTGIALGTPAYMSPEQAAGEHAVDGTSDVYSLGTVLYEMLAGEPPYTGPTAQAIAAKMMAGDPPSVRRTRPTVPAAVDAAVRKALSPVPADRYATGADFAKALDDAARTTGEPIAAGQPPRSTRRVPVRAALLGLALCVGAGLVFAWRVNQRSVSAPAGPVRLAVLPFENLGATDDEYFADGMTEELTSRLANVSGLVVIARTSANQYKRTTKTIPQIARELGVDFLIEGAVRWEKPPGGASRVRISPQVVRAKDGTHVWAEQYDKAYGTAIFEMQSDIAEHVANALSVTLLSPEQKAVHAVPTTNLEAYNYFLRGQAYSSRGVQDWEADRLALESYQHAVTLDPRFALAHAWVAHTHWWMYYDGYDESLPTGVTGQQRLELVREAAQRALALDPDLPKAHTALAYYYRETAGDTARFLDELEHALRGDPDDAQAVADRGSVLVELGRRTEGIRNLERAVTLDPRSPLRLLTVAWTIASTGDYPTAEAYADRAMIMAPDWPNPHAVKAWLELFQGRMEGARAAMREGVQQAGEAKLLVAFAKVATGARVLRILDDEYGSAVKQLSWDTFGLDSADYYHAKAEAYRKDPVRGPAYFDSLATWAALRVHRGGEVGPEEHILWATGLAGSGRRDAAVREINRLLGDKSYAWNAFMREEAAEVCIMAALYDCAIEQIRLAMMDPKIMNGAMFKFDPIWDPLRGREDFQKLAEGNLAPR
jgi:TolB-like protein/Tfp pilus assembly protein PilF